MVPFGLTQDQFSARYRRCLDHSSARLIEELRQLFGRTVPSTVRASEVQIFFGDDGLNKPAVWIYYRGDNNKVDHSDPAIFPGRSMQLSTGLECMDDFDESYFNDSLFNGLYIAANSVKLWFAECWWKAGGWAYPIPVKLKVHDDFGDGTTIDLSEHR